MYSSSLSGWISPIHLDPDPDCDFDPEEIMTVNGFNCSRLEQPIVEMSPRRMTCESFVSALTVTHAVVCQYSLPADILALRNHAMRLPSEFFLNVPVPELSNHCESDTRAWGADDL
jgi:hypothetical protein